MRSVQKVFQPCNVKNIDLIEKDTRYKKHCNIGISVLCKVGTLGPHTVLPVSLPLFKTLCKIPYWITIRYPMVFS